MKIWNIPIESLEERYSADWNRWFPREFKKLNVTYETIYGEELTSKIEQGAFLDVVGTNYFKASQIQKICQKIYSGEVKNGDVFLFHDLWFPGLESLAYIRDALDLDFKITGLLHAGTWDSQDFLSHKGMEKWARSLETSWFQFIDAVFVATEFHQDLIRKKRKGRCPIYVTGFPIYDEHSDSKVKKENIIVFPHRLDSEKQPEEFDELENLFQFLVAGSGKWKFVKSKEVTSTKEEYYDLLNRSKIAVSCALQETWGIAMQEAVLAGCVPFVPDRLSYKELYPGLFRYENLEDLVIRMEMCIKSELKYPLVSSIKDSGENAIPDMVSIIEEL